MYGVKCWEYVEVNNHITNNIFNWTPISLVRWVQKLLVNNISRSLIIALCIPWYLYTSANMSSVMSLAGV
jgi:hypothetical protein